MIAKVCPSCGKRSYSSSLRGGLECPNCVKEIKRENETRNS